MTTVPAALLVVAAPAALAVGGSPGYRPNRADNQRARIALIRRTDVLSVYSADSRGIARPVVPRCPGLYTPNRSGLTVTGKALALYTNGADGVGSGSAVFKSQAQAIQYWRLTVRPAYGRCLAKLYAAAAPAGTTAKIVSAGAFRVGPTGADATAGYRLVTRFSEAAGRSEFTVRRIVFMRSGRALVHLVFADLNHECTCAIPLTRVVAQRLISAAR